MVMSPNPASYKTDIHQYSPGEETVNAASHGLGIILSITGLVFLIIYSVSNGNGYHLVSSIIYGTTLIFLYSASTLYHAAYQPKIKRFFQQLDHCAIFLLIGGTYTPFTLVTLQGGWGWTIFGLVWGLAAVGCILELLLGHRFKRLSLAVYIGLGWIIIIAVKPMIDSIDKGGLLLLFAGGLSYSLGTFFYAHEKKAYNHAIWHLFVLGGSVFHFFAVFCYVIP